MTFYGSSNMQSQMDDIHSKATNIVPQNVENNEYDRQMIEKFYHTMYSYMLAKDVDNLAKMMTDDFALIHMTGLRQPKQEYLRCISDGELNYFTEETDHVHVDLNGDKAVLIGQSRVNAAVFGGGRHTWPLQLVIDMKKQDGKWLMTGAKASTY
ncbi:MAG: nuclear transport factor 2 family protein [Acidaminococcaceae bacterium]